MSSSIDENEVIAVKDDATLISSLKLLCLYEMGIAPCFFKQFFRNSYQTLRFLALNEFAFKIHSEASNLIIACSGQLESLSFEFTFTRTPFPILPEIRFLRLSFQSSEESLDPPNFEYFAPKLLESTKLVELDLKCFNTSDGASWTSSKSQALHLHSLFINGGDGEFPTILRRILVPGCVKRLECRFTERSSEIVEVVVDGLRHLALLDDNNFFDIIARCKSLFSFITNVTWWTSGRFAQNFKLPIKFLIVDADTPLEFMPLYSIITKPRFPNLERVYLLCDAADREDFEEFFQELPELYYDLTVDARILSKWNKELLDVLDMPDRVQMGGERSCIDFSVGF
ncbi:hypothetical protein BT69DRAFT_1299921 [Atractiella rhizophila]|nr:hypothetical protein BT69DRAFT_1299921 [Atractiella rhizophila]